MSGGLRVGRHRHFLGAWDPTERVLVARGATTLSKDLAWTVPTEAEIAELCGQEHVADAALTDDATGEAVVAAMTVPAKVRRQLWELGWDDEAETLAPRDQEAFAAYGRRVVAFFRATGVSLGGPDVPCPTRLVALAPGTNPVAEDNPSPGVMTALVNVGESDCRVVAMSANGAVSLRVPSSEACLLVRVARPYHVVVPDDAEFGLLLSLG